MASRIGFRSSGRGKTVLAVGLSAAVAGIVACACMGCVVEDNHPPPPPSDTEIEFEETLNIGQYCGGPLTSWTVTNRETGDTGTAGCEQPVLFTALVPGTFYTFDIDGYAGSRLCWQGTCGVPAAGGTTTFADCSGEITHLCGY